MDSVVTSILAFMAIFFGALAGVWLARRLPEPHLSSESRTAVSVSMAVVGTLTALVMGLLISNASSSFTARTDAIHSLAIDVIKLDRALQQYGPEAGNIRETLQSYAQSKTRALGDQSDVSSLDLSTLEKFEAMNNQVLELQPIDGRKRQILAQTVKLLDSIADARWLLIEKSGTSLPSPVLALLIFWLALLFGSFGLFAPRNVTVIAVLLLCALAISGGIFMVLELGTSTRGLIRVSTAPMITAINEIASTR
jgi:CRP-like cAMP-binding protein